MTATATKPKRPAAEFAGMTAETCASACNTSGCIISGNIYCAHPRKGGLQAPEMHKPDVLARFERAKKRLGLDRAIEKFDDGGKQEIA